MLLVPAHNKLMKPLPSIKSNFCVLGRSKRGKRLSLNFPLATAWLWGMAPPSHPRSERFWDAQNRLHATGSKGHALKSIPSTEAFSFQVTASSHQASTGGSFLPKIRPEPASRPQDCLPGEHWLIHEHFSCAVPVPPRSSGLCDQDFCQSRHR